MVGGHAGSVPRRLTGGPTSTTRLQCRLDVASPATHHCTRRTQRRQGGTMASIKLFRGAFGHVSVLNAASDLVTHAHPEVHVIIWLEGDPGRMTVGDVEFRPGPDEAVCVNSLRIAQPPFFRRPPGLLPRLLPPAGLGEGASRAGRAGPLFRDPRVQLDSGLARPRAAACCRNFLPAPTRATSRAYEIERMIERPDRRHRRRAGQGPGAGDARTPARPPHPQGAGADARPMSPAGSASTKWRAASAFRGRISSPCSRTRCSLTPNVYWNTLRMEEALRQIEASEESLTAVACNLGFTTQAQFHALLPRPCRRAADALPRRCPHRGLTLFQTSR